MMVRVLILLLTLASCASPVNDAILRYALMGGKLTP